MSASIKPSQGVLRHQNTDNSNVGGTRTLCPTDTIDAGTVNKSGEYEFGRLVCRSFSEDGNGEGKCPN